MKHTILILLLFIFTSIIVNAQDSYTLRGKVTDGETGEALIGAMVIVENSDPAIVSVTDFDGNFSLENIPNDVKKIAVSFMSYKTQIIENINIVPGGIEVLNIVLEKVAENIDEVVISAKSLTNTDAAINTVQKNSAGLVNGVSSQQMSRLGDGNAVSALKRVSGVSVSEGKYVYIRGLSDRYSKVTLNFAEIPGLDPNKNTVQMDMFPSNIIDNIIENVNDDEKPIAIKAIVDKLSKYRQIGLNRDGEFSTENIVFKMLRYGGVLKDLVEIKNELLSKSLSK